MHEPPIQFDPRDDARPIIVWGVVFVVLMVAQWLGMHCLFGVCAFDDHWFPNAATGATVAMLVSGGVFWIFDKLTGR